MSSGINIIEKPDWVSWDDIKQCLKDSHSVNRAKGINMTHYQWPAIKIKESLGENGFMLVALDGKKLVGTAGVGEKSGKSWYANGRYGYMCFAGVLPEYSGCGIYRALVNRREEIAKSRNYQILVFDTHCKNKKVQKIALKNGYRYVRFFQAQSRDHYSVVMAKWLNGCPYTKFYCCYRYLKSKLKVLLVTRIFHK